MKKFVLLATLLSTVLTYGETLQEIQEKAQKEGEVLSVGMPDNWANWKDTWSQIKEKYNIKHSDTDMSSAQEMWEQQLKLQVQF